jgi:hypothetical protein
LLKLSLPVRLVLLVAGTTLPLILFAAAIIFSHYERDREDASRRVLATIRSIRLVLDAEMQRMTGGLQVLSLTNALRDGDFEGFRRITRGFLDQYREGGVVLVANRDGRLVSLRTQRISRACRRAITARSGRRFLRKKGRSIPTCLSAR